MPFIWFLIGFLSGFLTFFCFWDQKFFKKWIKYFTNLTTNDWDEPINQPGSFVPYSSINVPPRPLNQSARNRSSKKKNSSSPGISLYAGDVSSSSDWDEPINQPGSFVPYSSINVPPRPLNQSARNRSSKKKNSSSPGQYRTLNPSASGNSSRKKKTSSTVSIQNPNVAFYENKIPAKPENTYLDQILENWFGDYDRLHNTATYIQWLFPNRNPGSNHEASVLTNNEAKIIRGTPELKNKVRQSFTMMLDFYGMWLTDDDTVELTSNYQKRLEYLNQRDSHHFMCISRILLALKDLGHYNLTFAWMEFLAELIYIKHQLPNAIYSFEQYWMKILEDKDQEELTKIMTLESFQDEA